MKNAFPRLWCALVLASVAAAGILESPRLMANDPLVPPKGEVLKFSFAKSAIYPGTVREYWIYVPRQFDGTSPACVHVNQDGIQWDAPAVFDRLIHERKMPVTIGVFVMPGRVPSTTPHALDRFNRSYEYDGLGDDYARFLLKELLPDAETRRASDGRTIVLSHQGNDRSIGGSSSGAICAFTAAWERPAEFSRVFSAIGTYVGLRGGHTYSTLVRKVEPKPLRIFLEDGSNDLNLYGGDWWMADSQKGDGQNFAPDGRLIAASGDHAILSWSQSGTSERIAEGFQGNDIVVNAEGRIFVTEPDSSGTSPSKIHSISPTGEDRIVDTGLNFSNGICLSPDQQLLYVADSRTHWVWSYSVETDGTLSNKQRYYHLHVPDTADDSGADGMRVDRDGRLYVATRMGIQICDQAGRVTCILPTPSGRVSNVALGGKDFDTLLATCGDKVYMRKLKVKAALNFLPPILPPAPKL